MVLADNQSARSWMNAECILSAADKISQGGEILEHYTKCTCTMSLLVIRDWQTDQSIHRNVFNIKID